MKKLFTLLVLVGIFSIPAYSQDQPIRIGVKLGYPNFLGLNAEYVTPLLGGRIGPSVDYSFLPERDLGDVTAKFNYFEIGANIYVIRPGKGLYLNVGYGRFAFDGSVTETVDFGAPVGEAEGTGSIDLALNRVNFKLGSKLGGRVYFRTEFGWALGLGDSSLNVGYEATSNGQNVSQTEEWKIPKLLAGGPLANLGFGVGF